MFKEAVKGLDSKTNKIQHLILGWLIASMKEFSFLVSLVESSRFSSYMSAVLMRMRFKERSLEQLRVVSVYILTLDAMTWSISSSVLSYQN